MSFSNDPFCSIAHLFLSFSTASTTMPILQCPCGRQFDIRLDATQKTPIEQSKLTHRQSLRRSQGLIDLPMANQPAPQPTPRSPRLEQRPAPQPALIGQKPAPQPITSSSSGQEDRQQKRLELKKLRLDLTKPNCWGNWQGSTPGAEGSTSWQPTPPACDPPQYLRTPRRPQYSTAVQRDDRSRSPRRPPYSIRYS